MSFVRIALAASLVGLCGCVIDEPGTGPVPVFSHPLLDLETPRAFTVPRDGRYEVQINFPMAGMSPEARSIVERARGPEAGEPALPIQLELNISVGGDPVMALTGYPRIEGTVDYTSGGLGGGLVRASGFVLGTVELRAGAPYQISGVVREIAPALKPGAPLIRIDAAKPPLEER
jgi:hypothetical protein